MEVLEMITKMEAARANHEREMRICQRSASGFQTTNSGGEADWIPYATIGDCANVDPIIEDSIEAVRPRISKRTRFPGHEITFGIVNGTVPDDLEAAINGFVLFILSNASAHHNFRCRALAVAIREAKAFV